MRKKLFGNNIDPACAYCSYGRRSKDSQMILCEKQGVVSPCFYCRKFHYSPFKRIPKRSPILPQFDKSDFEL